MRKTVMVGALALLAGCGVSETAVTPAAVAEGTGGAVEGSKSHQEEILRRLQASERLERRRLDEAEQAAR